MSLTKRYLATHGISVAKLIMHHRRSQLTVCLSNNDRVREPHAGCLTGQATGVYIQQVRRHCVVLSWQFWGCCTALRLFVGCGLINSGSLLEEFH